MLDTYTHVFMFGFDVVGIKLKLKPITKTVLHSTTPRKTYVPSRNRCFFLVKHDGGKNKKLWEKTLPV